MTFAEAADVDTGRVPALLTGAAALRFKGSADEAVAAGRTLGFTDTLIGVGWVLNTGT